MSRTFRNRRFRPTKYTLIGFRCIWWEVSPHSKLKDDVIIIAKWRSDSFREFQEPGPSWYRNLYSERPHRRASKEELRKFNILEEYEPMILSKPKLEYWT